MKESTYRAAMVLIAVIGLLITLWLIFGSHKQSTDENTANNQAPEVIDQLPVDWVPYRTV